MMEIRKIKTKEIEQLVPLYKHAFPVHNIFTKPDKDIVEYLKRLGAEFIVASEDGKIIAALAITRKENTYLGKTHTLASLKHLAVHESHRGKGLGSKMLSYAESSLGRAKVEIKVACPIKKKFYEKNGYLTEGKLRSHYRPGETCYVMGKILEE